MVNYANSKVYKIEPICEHDECDVYYGSTTKEYLSQRMDKHRCDFKKNKMNAKCSSKLLFEKYGVENCVIILLESVNAKTNDELKAVEAKYIINKNCVNKCVPLRTNKQYKIDNKEQVEDYHKQYYEDNVDKINEQQKQYRTNNKDKINEKQRQRYLKKKEQANAEN